MDQNDRKIIDDLFTRLSEAEHQSPQRDAESEALIRDKLARRAKSMWRMGQTSSPDPSQPRSYYQELTIR